jgi:hypothetical protein
MAELIPEISGGTVVLLGSFNPKIFQPEWFARQKLLPQAEADASEIKVIGSTSLPFRDGAVHCASDRRSIPSFLQSQR